MNTLQTKVLIIGAGPSGLMMACQLARHQVPFMLIDKKEGITMESKALAVQARTMEIYQQMGIAQEAKRRGTIGKAFNFIVKGKPVQRIHLAAIGEHLSPFPNIHILEQSENEAILEQFLATEDKSVLWNTHLQSFSQTETEVEAVLIDKNGEPFTVLADWMIGADGASSLVRKELGMDFLGDTHEQTFFVADSQVDWEYPDGELYVCWGKKDFLAFFPMKGEKRFRVVGVLPDDMEDPTGIVFEEFIKTLTPKMNIDLVLSQTNWFKTYKIHHRVAPDFQRGRCFLVGDAAHIHSPVGGQGMNTGLLDAYNLAWKLALVVKEQAKASLLKTYTEERLPFAEELVKSTDRAFSMVVSTNPILQFLRLQVMPSAFKMITSQEAMREFAFKRISQIGISYQESSINRNYKNREPDRGPQAGDRFPFITSASSNSFKWLTGTAFKALYFFTKREERTIVQLKNYFDLSDLDIELLQFDKEKYTPYFEALGIQETAFFIVRPDMYIGYRSEVVDLMDFEIYFDRVKGG